MVSTAESSASHRFTGAGTRAPRATPRGPPSPSGGGPGGGGPCLSSLLSRGSIALPPAPMYTGVEKVIPPAAVREQGGRAGRKEDAGQPLGDAGISQALAEATAASSR